MRLVPGWQTPRRPAVPNGMTCLKQSISSGHSRFDQRQDRFHVRGEDRVGEPQFQVVSGAGLRLALVVKPGQPARRPGFAYTLQGCRPSHAALSS